MMMATTMAARSPARLNERPRVSWRDNMITLLLAIWMEAGGLLDGWAHANVPELETFWTPWHAVYYSGFAATAAWVWVLVLRHWRLGKRGLAAVPVGYGLGLVGAAAWPLAGGLDALWHTVFGIERGAEILLSPTHLLLGLSELLLLTSPLRAAWADPASPRAPKFGAFFPTLLSATLAAQVVGFFLMYAMAFLQLFEAAQVTEAVPAVLTTNLLLIGTMLLLLRRWQTPLGTFALLFSAQAVLLNVTANFAAWPGILIMLIAGLAADLLIRALRPAPSRPVAFRAVAALTSLTLWTIFMAVLSATGTLDWSLPLSAGTVALATGSSFALALLMAPPPVPLTAQVLQAEPAGR
jgi:hypothetical protein